MLYEVITKKLAPNNTKLGLKLIEESKSKFVSRGDDSGTNKKEISLWKEAGVITSYSIHYTKLYE